MEWREWWERLWHQEYTAELAANGQYIPDSFNRLVRTAAREIVENQDSSSPSNQLDFADADLEDWMEIARRHACQNMDSENDMQIAVFCYPTHRWPVISDNQNTFNPCHIN